GVGKGMAPKPASATFAYGDESLGRKGEGVSGRESRASRLPTSEASEAKRLPTPGTQKEETLQTDFRTSAAGCEELESLSLVDTSECCEICHSADVADSMGPCRVALPDGRVARVCCAAKRKLDEGGTR
ncbi:MAG: hypothetical protein ACRDSJ_02465, partial [Rubrobacteraceae bacterium]